eukprot:5021200-Pyramimonas_sp.AAC.1
MRGKGRPAPSRPARSAATPRLMKLEFATTSTQPPIMFSTRAHHGGPRGPRRPPRGALSSQPWRRG